MTAAKTLNHSKSKKRTNNFVIHIQRNPAA